jgi:hypothetical protein
LQKRIILIKMRICKKKRMRIFLFFEMEKLKRMGRLAIEARRDSRFALLILADGRARRSLHRKTSRRNSPLSLRGMDAWNFSLPQDRGSLPPQKKNRGKRPCISLPLAAIPKGAEFAAAHRRRAFYCGR